MSADIRPGRAVLGMRWRGWRVVVVAVTVAVTFAQLIQSSEADHPGPYALGLLAS
jgi:hypothetical protein